MKSAQNKMNNSSCSADTDDAVRDRKGNSAIDSTRNQGDLKEIRNQGDLRDVTEKGGNKDRFNMADS